MVLKGVKENTIKHCVYISEKERRKDNDKGKKRKVSNEPTEDCRTKILS